MPGDRVDEAGRVRVDSCLRVEGTTNIFAVGDCCNTQGGIRLAGVHLAETRGQFRHESCKIGDTMLTIAARPF